LHASAAAISDLFAKDKTTQQIAQAKMMAQRCKASNFMQCK
jgi:hypothetical protein